jgi:hypothetical protein
VLVNEARFGRTKVEVLDEDVVEVVAIVEIRRSRKNYG